MKIQINSDSNITLTTASKEGISSELTEKLGRFADHITRLEIQLTDQNSDTKSGDDDIRCVIEARLEGKQPVSIEARQGNVAHAVAEAADKMGRRLDSLLGKEITLKRKSQRDATRPELLD